MIYKHKSNKIKENSNTVRHLNNGTDHRHSKSCCDQSSPARRTKKLQVSHANDDARSRNREDEMKMKMTFYNVTMKPFATSCLFSYVWCCLALTTCCSDVSTVEKRILCNTGLFCFSGCVYILYWGLDKMAAICHVWKSLYFYQNVIEMCNWQTISFRCCE